MKLVREHINEKFSEDGDPIYDMGIGHRAQMEKLNKTIDWDWNVIVFPDYYEDEIIDIITYKKWEFVSSAKSYNPKPIHIKVSRVIQTIDTGVSGIRKKTFYLATSDLGEPYSDDPSGAPTPEKALAKEKKFLEEYYDSL